MIGAGLDVEELHAPELAPADVAVDVGEQRLLGVVALGPPPHGVERSERTFATRRRRVWARRSRQHRDLRAQTPGTSRPGRCPRASSVATSAASSLSIS